VSVPVVILSSIDPVLRDTAVFSALTGAPRTAVLRTDLDPHAGTLRRVVSDVTGVSEDETAPLAHTCLGCAIREDSLPTLARMAASGDWDRILVALPLSAPAGPLARPLTDPRISRGVGVHLATTATVVDTESLQDNLFGEDHLSERGLALSINDHRSVGEALAGQLRHADLVLTSGGSGPTGSGPALADHLRGTGSVQRDLHDMSTWELFVARYVHRLAESRLDPQHACPGAGSATTGAWTLDLETDRPLHPERLMAELENLGTGPLCSWGRFFLPSRPDTVAEWDGAGGQLSIGDAGGWAGTRRSTRLVFTGVEDVRRRISEVFRAVQLTDRELASTDRWVGADDGFDPWLGDRLHR